MTKRASYRVCVVEDDTELSAVIEQVLKSIDPQVEIDWATSAEEALYLLKNDRAAHSEKRPYDLIIADIFLEGTSTGFDLLRVCNREYPHIPLVVTSGMDADEFIASIGENAVCPPFMQKPFSVGECRQTLHGLLNEFRPHR